MALYLALIHSHMQLQFCAWVSCEFLMLFSWWFPSSLPYLPQFAYCISFQYWISHICRLHWANFGQPDLYTLQFQFFWGLEEKGILLYLKKWSKKYLDYTLLYLASRWRRQYWSWQLSYPHDVEGAWNVLLQRPRLSLAPALHCLVQKDSRRDQTGCGDCQQPACHCPSIQQPEGQKKSISELLCTALYEPTSTLKVLVSFLANDTMLLSIS